MATRKTIPKLAEEAPIRLLVSPSPHYVIVTAERTEDLEGTGVRLSGHGNTIQEAMDDLFHVADVESKAFPKHYRLATMLKKIPR